MSIAPDSPRRSLHALPPGTVLHDYVIESELGSGGFSIVYLARHRLNSDWLFAIKEYFPRELAVRGSDGAGVRPVDTESGDAFEDGLARFRDEAEQLRKFRNEPYIVSCLNYFERNGTAYLVMDYDDGLPLSEFLERREAAGQPFTGEDLLAVVEPLLEGLAVVHRAGVLHRDIKPGNVFVRRQDDITGRPAHPVLIDFGAAKQNYLASHSRSRAPYTPGYAAYEQVSSEGDIGPWTDIYAIGALMWRMVVGGYQGDERLFAPGGGYETIGTGTREAVPHAAERRAYALHRRQPDPMVPAAELGAGRFSPRLLKAIDRCLALYPEDRVGDCAALSGLLDGADRPKISSTRTKSRASTDSGAPVKTTRSRPGIVAVAVGGMLAILVTVGSYFALREQRSLTGPVAEDTRERVVSELLPPPGGTFSDALISGGRGPEMMVVPAGRFQMGCVSGQDCRDREFPVEEVVIPQVFAVSKFEVTFDDWNQCVAGDGCNGHQPDDVNWGRGNRPVIYVSWENAQVYVSWLSSQTGKVYRLLSESEWEYVARAGSSSAYSWGGYIGVNRANCRGCGSPWDGMQTAPAGSFPPNAFGMHDMHGNVWEWVEDCWIENYSGVLPYSSAWRSGNCDYRVARGGSFGANPTELRSAHRIPLSAGFRIVDLGFRVARTLRP